MSWWIEMRCDARPQPSGCYSARNDGPMRLALSSTVSAAAALRALREEVRAAGWRMHGKGYARGWACPSCARKSRL